MVMTSPARTGNEPGKAPTGAARPFVGPTMIPCPLPLCVVVKMPGEYCTTLTCVVDVLLPTVDVAVTVPSGASQGICTLSCVGAAKKNAAAAGPTLNAAPPRLVGSGTCPADCSTRARPVP